MELGEKLRQARLEAGLTQRQVCGETITRNMLSQIENGSAKPSMQTLQYLAARLGKSVGYFLEEQAPQLPNLAVMEAARQAKGKQVLELLAQYESPDPVFDPERWLLEALTCLELAAQAVEERPAFARELLERAAQAGGKTPYYTSQLEAERLQLCHRAGAPVEESRLPSLDEQLLLRAELAGATERGARLLDAMQERPLRWYYLRGRCYEQTGNLEMAVACYHQAEGSDRQIYSRLEQCYMRLEDYKKAYEYACKQR